MKPTGYIYYIFSNVKQYFISILTCHKLFFFTFNDCMLLAIHIDSIETIIYIVKVKLTCRCIVIKVFLMGVHACSF